MRLFIECTLLLFLTVPTHSTAEVRYPVEQRNLYTTKVHKLKKEKRLQIKPQKLHDPGVMVALLFGLFFTILFGTFIFAWLSTIMPLGWAALLAYGSFVLFIALIFLFIVIKDSIQRGKQRKKSKKDEKEGRKSYSF